ncbi:hypothetical protein [Siansivirga zeaxanthinifaciens]|uniref:YtkA-like domain-containing protein n=1 Tax=Siansivirga zeaxanthinifaciens CC-SAMT-1 TaxID=1454006 RepID=A0A0C5W9X1_9FLAO|nr:hypothetical protein [Siansivirga zeaxanthinifaciens]AJR03112.1 hypothetical protein AW14_05125 [Siansivirga zeaxanthinifaciens CC-SAMT-1]
MTLKYFLPALFIILFATSCSTDNDDTLTQIETEGLIKIQDLVNDTHIVELYNPPGEFKTGYNAIHIRIKDKTTNQYIENAAISWTPIMSMPTMNHSCPKSAITKVVGKETLYEGFIIYQMSNLDGTGWSLTINYTINDSAFSVTEPIIVMQNKKQHVTSFMGSDNNRYVLALVEPKTPKIAVNKMKVALYKMENMMSFPVVENYTINLDPRMPGMGNHSSPNNKNLTFNNADQMYYGDLSLTMTGYWVLNLKLFNAEKELLKGEDVTADNTQSSLYLELEF